MNYQESIRNALNELDYEKHITKQFYQELEKKYGSDFFNLIEEKPWTRDDSQIYTFGENNEHELYLYTCEDCYLYAPKDIQLPPYPKLKANNCVITNPNLQIRGERNELYNTIIDTQASADYICCCRLIDTQIFTSCQLLRVDTNQQVPWREEQKIDSNNLYISVFLESPHMISTTIETQISNTLFDKRTVDISNADIVNSSIINETTIKDATIYHSCLGTSYNLNKDLTLEVKPQRNIINKKAQIINCEISDCVVEEGVILNNINAISHGLQLHFHSSLLEPNKQVIESDTDLQNLYNHFGIVINEGETQSNNINHQRSNDFDIGNW